jgi:hypothetical protein
MPLQDRLMVEGIMCDVCSRGLASALLLHSVEAAWSVLVT